MYQERGSQGQPNYVTKTDVTNINNNWKQVRPKEVSPRAELG